MQSRFLDTLTPVVKNILAINLILWLATLALPNLMHSWGINFNISDILGMHYWESEKFNAAQLITYSFMHGGFFHMFFNMFAVYMFGSALENFFGSRRFLFFYLFTAVGAGIVQQLFWMIDFQPIFNQINQAMATYPNQIAQIQAEKLNFLNQPLTVGASGSVFGLLLAFGWFFPSTELYMFFVPFPIKARIYVIIYAVMELFFGVANFSGDNIAHFAHLGGMLFGVILIVYWNMTLKRNR
jgi:membrane associated rhomboid family serine protease